MPSGPVVRRMFLGRVKDPAAVTYAPPAVQHATPAAATLPPSPGRPGIAVRWGIGSEGQPPWRRLAGWSFAIALWLFATFFLLGDLGWWNDDYFFNQRNPATGGYQQLILASRDPFLPPLDHINPWRPLHLTGTAALITLGWNHPAAVHAVGVMIHGLNVLLLYRLLRGLGRSVHAAAGCALLHAVYASHYEVVVWPSAFCTGISDAAFIFAACCYVRYARTGSRLAAWGVPFAAIIIAGMNEQAAGPLPALPLAYWAVASAQEPLGRRLWRSIWPVAAALVVIGVYVINLQINGQPGLGTSKETFATIPEWPRRLEELLTGVRNRMMLRDGFRRGAWAVGLDELARRPGYTLAWFAPLTLLLVAAFAAWVRTPTHQRFAGDADSPASAESRSGLVAAFGIAFFFGALGPLMLVQGYPMLSRTFYLVSMALAVLYSLGADAVARGVMLRRAAAVWRAAVGGVLALALMAMAVLFVGAQARWQRVNAADVDQARQLRELFPEAPKNTVFLPAVNDHNAVGSGDVRFDMGVMDAWRFSWSTPYIIKWAFRRDDVYAFYWLVDQPREPYRGMSEEAVLFEWCVDSPYRPNPQTGLIHLPWSNVVPFVVDRSGRVRPITRWVLRGRDGEPDVAVEPPQTAAAYRAGRVEWNEVPFPRVQGARR